MSLFPLLRGRIRALLIILICAALIAIGLVVASRQHAGAPTRYHSGHSAGVTWAVPDKGVITPAATITVNSISDSANNADGLCTLREAITAANNNTASGATAGECAAGSSSGSDTINFSVTGTINLTGALPAITSSMSINGPGSSQLTVRRNTGGDYRILNVSGGATVIMSGLTAMNGKAPDIDCGFFWEQLCGKRWRHPEFRQPDSHGCCGHR